MTEKRIRRLNRRILIGRDIPLGVLWGLGRDRQTETERQRKTERDKVRDRQTETERA